jgi:hypothetical protein
MKSPFFPTLSLCCLFVFAEATADTILLNNGESHEGKIVYEDDNFCLLEVQVTEGIKDEKKILKSDIKSISKQAPDIEEFLKLKELVPVPDLLGVADYEARIKRVEDFIKEFPRSEKLNEARKIDELLKSELQVVRGGGMKLAGKLIPLEEYLSTAYAYDQLIAVHKINRDIGYRNFLGALRLFTDYETKFAAGNLRADLVPKIKQVLQVYKASVSESLAGFDSRMKSREAGLARMAMEDRQKTENALEQQMVNLKARFVREKASKNTWITPDENLKESLTESLRQVENEIKRLDSPQKNGLVLISLEGAYREAWESLPRASEEEQKVILEKLKRDRMPEHYLLMLQGRLKSE